MAGAVVMIKEGCLEGINEVYGLHNMPLAKIG
jgi:metal-dependent amidase/aminoacylase/carboxypeptidase family protein